MARYDNTRYSAEMPLGYSPRDLIELLIDTATDGMKDRDLILSERRRLRVYRERLFNADVKLTGPGDIDREHRTDLFYQAVESICGIMADRVENPIALRQMMGLRQRRATNEKRLASAMIDGILAEVAKPACERNPNDRPGSIAGRIMSTLIDRLDTDERLKGKEKLFPREQQAVAKRLKKVWHLVRAK
jgi:hypothetical protein